MAKASKKLDHVVFIMFDWLELLLIRPIDIFPRAQRFLVPFSAQEIDQREAVQPLNTELVFQWTPEVRVDLITVPLEEHKNVVADQINGIEHHP